MHITDMLMYILFQFAGSFAGAGLIWSFCPGKYWQALKSGNQSMLGQPGVATDMAMPAFIFETLGTFILTFMVFALAVDKRAPKHVFGIGIGGALGISVLAFGAVSGAALNPARWLGPAVLTGSWAKQISNIWIYTVGPFTGGAAAAALYNWVLYRKDEDKPVAKDVEFE